MINAIFPDFYAFGKPVYKFFGCYTLWIDLESSKQKPFKTRFLISGYHFSKKNQPVVSKQVVSILRVLTVFVTKNITDEEHVYLIFPVLEYKSIINWLSSVAKE